MSSPVRIPKSGYGLGVEVFDVGEHLACPRQEGSTLAGQLDLGLPRRTMKQHNTEFLLKQTNLTTNRRLRDANPRRSSSEVLSLSNGYKICELVQAHRVQITVFDAG
jgi:hypothetical protein